MYRLSLLLGASYDTSRIANTVYGRSPNDGTPCAMKVARTVWAGGKRVVLLTHRGVKDKSDLSA